MRLTCKFLITLTKLKFYFIAMLLFFSGFTRDATFRGNSGHKIPDCPHF